MHSSDPRFRRLYGGIEYATRDERAAWLEEKGLSQDGLSGQEAMDLTRRRIAEAMRELGSQEDLKP